jgi:UDP-3-O-[3-hydroxymyristoyl] glucosamine N-acyltransferase
MITGGFFFKVVMARGRRLRKSAGGELETSKENGIASNDANLLPNVAVSNKAILLPNVTMSNEAILLPNVVVSDKADAEQHVVTTVE